MEFIDKTKQKVNGEKIVSDFLDEFHGTYRQDLYSEFKNPRKHELINLLLQEQNNRCCYCMRSLDIQKDNISFEHLIPQSINKKSKFDEYIKFDTVLNEENICLEDDFIKSANPKIPPFPHTVAYQNLTVSCSGVNFPSKEKHEDAAHCNNFRKDKKIKPIILYKTISDEIEYKSNGFVIWYKETEDIPTIEELGLNDVTLKMIRRIWLYAGKQNINLLNITKQDKDNFLYDLIAEVENKEDDDMLLSFFENESYWNLLKKYDYFASYRLKKLARQLSYLSATELRGLIENIKSQLI